MKALFLAITLATASISAHAQELQEVVVTAQRTQSYEGVPAVTVRKPADFLVQAIRLVNDSRSPDLRKSEIIGTIDALLKRAADLRNVALSYGEGFLVPIDLSSDALQIIEDQKRSDTSVVDIYVKVTLTEKDDTKKRIGDLRSFIKQTDCSGCWASRWQPFNRAPLGYGVPALEGGFGFLQYYIHPNVKTVHDRIPGTIVIDDAAI